MLSDEDKQWLSEQFERWEPRIVERLHQLETNLKEAFRGLSQDDSQP